MNSRPETIPKIHDFKKCLPYFLFVSTPSFKESPENELTGIQVWKTTRSFHTSYVLFSMCPYT